MLPSFRLIAATFLCGFLVVFAGLRLAVSLNDLHEGLPVLAAHAAPVSITPIADREARRSLAPVPVMYDMRFAVGTITPTLVRVPPMILDVPAPPPSIVPPEAVDQEGLLAAVPDAEPGKEAPKEEAAEATVAAVQPAAPVILKPADVPDAPAAPEAPAVAASDPLANPDTPDEQPAAETLAPITQATANESQAIAPPAIEESLPSPEVAAAAAETPAAPTTGPEPKPRSPAAALPAAMSQSAKTSPRARVKVARKKQVRVARRAAPANRLENIFGDSNDALATLPGAAER